MNASILHEPGRPGENGHAATWREGDRDKNHSSEDVEHLLDGPSSVNVTIDWSAGLDSSRGYLDQVEVATKNYVASYGMAFSHALAQAGTPAERLDISAAASSGDQQTGPPTIYVEVRGRVRGLDQPGFERIARQAEQASTVWNALLGAYWPGTPDVRLNAILVEQAEPDFPAGRAIEEAAPTILPDSNGAKPANTSPLSPVPQPVDRPSPPGEHGPAAASESQPIRQPDDTIASQAAEYDVPRPVPAPAATPGGFTVLAACPAPSPAASLVSAREHSTNGAGITTPTRPESVSRVPGMARSRIAGTRGRWLAGGFTIALAGGILLVQGMTHVPDLVVVRPGDVEPQVTAEALSVPKAPGMDVAVTEPSSSTRHAAPDAASMASAQSLAGMPASLPVPRDDAGLRLPPDQVAAGDEPMAAVTPNSIVAPAAEPAVPPAVQADVVAAPSSTSPSTVERPARSEISFLSHLPGWPENPQWTGWFADDGYHLAARHPNRFVAIRSPLEGQFHDVVVTGTFRKVGGPPGGGYGLILRDDGSAAGDGTDQGGRYYVFEAGDRGEVGVWRRDHDQWVDLLTWTKSEAVRPGGAPNELQVRAVGHRYTFLVNGTTVADLEDAVLQGGRVGIFAGGDFNEVVADRLIVEHPE